MLAGYLKFSSIPDIGFAHHYCSDKYSFDYGKTLGSFEITYINSGAMVAELYDKTFYINKGDILVLFRQLPIKLRSLGEGEQSHCTVQLQFDYDFELIEKSEKRPDDGFILPFVTKQGEYTDEMRKSLYEIVSKVSQAPDRRSLSASIKALEIMKKLDSIAREENPDSNTYHSHIALMAENFIKENIDKKISLSDISKEIGKSPNYINFAFKKEKGTTLNDYINREKVNLIITLMQKQGLHFTKACSCVGITDPCYGYRLFKKHTGITPNMFFKSQQMIRK